MHRLLTFAVVSAFGVAVAAMSAPASALAASEASTWEHNGSTVALEKNGEKRRIVYVRPRAALKKAGVKSGTVLFSGKTKKSGRVAGYAKIFRKGCDPVDYFVEGKIDPNKGEMVLQGQAPVYSGKNCKITGYSDDNGSSTLTFTSVSSPRDQDYASNGSDDSAEPVQSGNSARDTARNDDRDNARDTARNDARDTARNDADSSSRNSNSSRSRTRTRERDYAEGNDRTDTSSLARERDYADNGSRASRRRQNDERGDYYSRDDIGPDDEYYDDYYDEPAPRRSYRPYRPWWRD
ncbi:MAG: hypothetical protein P8Y67_02225 [Alphaproteobacteria bacterium]